MKIKLFGFGASLITLENGTRIFTDPCPGIKETADIVTVSHEHSDHNQVEAISGNPEVYRGPEPTVIKGIKFSAIPTYHDEKQGKDVGNNTIIYFEVDGIKVCHLGDLGHKLSDEHLAQIGQVDILMIPVLGIPMMPLELCNVVANQFNAKVIIPIHYWNKPFIPPVPQGRNWAPFFNVEEFLKDKENVIRIDGCEVEFKASTLPSKRHVFFIKQALDMDELGIEGVVRLK